MMNQPIAQTDRRIESIDILRGMVMIIMALDHVRDYFHIAANLDSPTNLETTTGILFFTRFITHFCAPTFVLLSGVSIYLQSQRKTKSELSTFLIKRGLWLILIEIVVISFGLSFNPNYNFIFFQVIWAIGISMVLLGLLVHLPFKVILGIGLLIVLGHNFLDLLDSSQGFTSNFWWDLLHNSLFTIYPITTNHALLIAYPFLPWTGLMMLGYCLGVFFTSKFSAEERGKYLYFIGLGLIGVFVLVRFTNLYGDPFPWSIQKDGFYTFLSFLNVNKYPPSLLFICVTIGPALLLLALLEKFSNGFTNTMSIYGRVAFFYYIIHFYLIHLVSTLCFLFRGHSIQDGTNVGTIFPFYFVAPGEGYSLAVVYFVWALIVLSLYPFCKWYDKYKTTHKEQWWLSYL